MQAADSVEHLSLLDLPEPWGLKFISGQYLDSASKLSLFHSCKQLNEMVMQHSKSTLLSLELLSWPTDVNASQDYLCTPADTARQLQVLVRTSKRARSFKLRLWQTPVKVRGWWLDEESMEMMGSTVCSFLQEAAKHGSCLAVAELVVEGATFQNILPAAAGQACPNLTKLVLRNCFMELVDGAYSTESYQSLQALQLVNVSSRANTEIQQKISGRSIVQRQLRGLTALKSLSIVACSERWDAGLQTDHIAIVNALAGQLTYLHIDVCGQFDVAKELRGLDWARLGSNIQHLQLTGGEAGDKHMRMFLEWPYLTHLEVDFNLMESFAGQLCRWEELTCTSISFHRGTLRGGSTGRLPLHSHLLLKVKEDRSWLELDSDPEEILQVIENMHKAQGVQLGDEVMLVTDDDTDLETFADILRHLLPVVATARLLGFRCGPMRGVAMGALCDFVCNNVCGMCIRFYKDCLWDASGMVSLVGKLPHNSTVELCMQGKDSEPLIMQLCLAATQRLTLILWADVSASFKQHIASALQACGSKLQQFYRRYGYILELTVQPGVTSSSSVSHNMPSNTASQAMV